MGFKFVQNLAQNLKGLAFAFTENTNLRQKLTEIQSFRHFLPQTDDFL
jgi:hypothetical protein